MTNSKVHDKIRDESSFITQVEGPVTFSCNVQNKLRPPTPSPNPAGKNLDPSRYMTKLFVTSPIVNTPARKHNPLFLL